MYKCNEGYNRTTEHNTRTCTGNGSSPNGVWNNAAPECPRKLFVAVSLSLIPLHMCIQLLTVETLHH